MMKRLLLCLALCALPALAQAQVTTSTRCIGRAWATASSTTITTTSSNVSIAGATAVFRVQVTARSTNGDRIYMSATAPATAASTPLDPGKTIDVDFLGGTQVSFISASGTQAVDIVITYL